MRVRVAQLEAETSRLNADLRRAVHDARTASQSASHFTGVSPRPGEDSQASAVTEAEWESRDAALLAWVDQELVRAGR